VKIKANTNLDDKQQTVSLTKIEAKHFGLGSSSNDETAYVALKYFDEEHQCFSEWDKSELKSFTQFIRKVNLMTWVQIQKQAGTIGNKVGLGYTNHKDPNVLPNKDLRNRLSPDITFFELRVTDEARVHGFRAKNTFFLIWLDRSHQIYPQ
jgi:hypothetical protein